MDKQFLRNEIRKKHRQISINDRIKFSTVISDNLIKILKDKNYKDVFAYYPLYSEPDIKSIYSYKANFYLPRCIDNEKMQFHLIKDFTSLLEGAFKTLEPSVEMPIGVPTKYCLIIVPGLAYSEEGVRLGNGKGYYDRYLSNYPDTYKIGVCFGQFLIDNLPREAHDQIVDLIITEKQILETYK